MRRHAIPPKRSNRWLPAALVLVVLPFSEARAELPAQLITPTRRSPVVQVVERVRAAVVNIHSERITAQGMLGPEHSEIGTAQNRVNGMGTGIIIDSRGYIVTNHHVVDDVQVLRVRLSDGSTYNAKVFARDPQSDLALLKIDTDKALPTLTYGTASDLMVGETVIAVGNAYGYEHTVTTGVVSAIKRDVSLNKEISYKSLIQTDASINPGNSGGPLLNINGELVGVNVAIRAGAQGIGFAIPVDTMIRVVGDMLNVKRRTGAWHGLTVTDVVQCTQTRTVRAVRVIAVEPNSPGAKAGVQVGDLLDRIGDIPVQCSFDLERAFIDSKLGQALEVSIRRQDGPAIREARCEMTLTAAAKPALTGADLLWKQLGIKVQPVPAASVTHVNPQLHGGLYISEVAADSPAARSGLLRGDILIGLHQWETLSIDNVTFVLNHPEIATFSPVRFFVIRANQVQRGWLGRIE